MTVQIDSGTFKQFHAKDPITNSIHVKVRSSATDFLHEALQRLPVSSVQIGGGSEFMQEFETARRAAGIPLHVLPPRHPDSNGSVERSNRTLRSGYMVRPPRRPPAK